MHDRRVGRSRAFQPVTALAVTEVLGSAGEKSQADAPFHLAQDGVELRVS